MTQEEKPIKQGGNLLGKMATYGGVLTGITAVTGGAIAGVYEGGTELIHAINNSLTFQPVLSSHMLATFAALAVTTTAAMKQWVLRMLELMQHGSMIR